MVGTKALASSGSDEVLAVATLSGKNTSKSLKFRNADNKDIDATVQSKGSNVYHYTLSLNATNASNGIYAYIQNGTATGQNIAKLSTKAYEKVSRTVVLVPIASGVNIPSNIESQLNTIYKQAIAEIKVEIAPEIAIDATDWDENKDGKIAAGDNKLMRDYTSEMRKIIKAYKKKVEKIDKDKFYLFVGIPASINALEGYMPINNQIGFIHLTNPSLKTIAHELGHGVFGLDHPQDLNNSTDLMGYGTGSSLSSNEWANIHSPQRKMLGGFLENDDDAAFSGINMGNGVNHPAFVKYILKALHEAYLDKSKLNLLSITRGTDAIITSERVIPKGSNKVYADDINIVGKKYSEIIIDITEDAFSYYNTNSNGVNFILSPDKKNIRVNSTYVIATESIEATQLLFDYLNNTVSTTSDAILFVNGYRDCSEITALSKTLSTDYARIQGVNTSDKNNYWDGIDQKFVNNIGSDYAYYIDGHNKITTSNHNVDDNIRKSKDYYLESHFSSTVNARVNVITENGKLKQNPCYHNESCVVLHTTPNVSGFNERVSAGESDGQTLYNKIKSGEVKVALNAKGEIIGKIDIVAHSMGFAHALGMIKVLKSKLAPGVKLGRFYIIAPENGCSGSVTLSDFEENGVWQYGSNEKEEKKYFQDGVAPQCGVNGLEKDNRVDYPKDGSVPRGFLDSHSIGNYRWIFTELKDRGGEVKPR